MSSRELPAPALRSGPLQIGHTNNSSNRLSILPLGACGALFNRLDHYALQCFGIAIVEDHVNRNVPMLRAGNSCAFYGILLGHEHRKIVGEGNIADLQSRVV